MRKPTHKLHTNRKTEQGYALIAMMGVVLFALILTTAAAPKVQMEAQREREEELLWRGQQIAMALGKYKSMRGTYPNDLNDLVKGFEIGVKKIRLLRPSALCDPMTPCTGGEGNWRLVHPGDPLPKDLLEAYLEMQKRGPMVLPPPPPDLVAAAQLGAIKLPGQASDTRLDGNIGTLSGGNPPPNPGQLLGLEPDSSDSESKLKKLPIIGVVSRRGDRMFRAYYGITEYNRTLFFPYVPVLAGGFIAPGGFGQVVATGGADPRCRDFGGGVMIDGKCWGGLKDGICPPSQRKPDGTCTPTNR